MTETIKQVRVPKAESLIKFKSKYSTRIHYVTVDGFYDILPDSGGGRGVNYTFLGGYGNGSTPEVFFEKVKEFKDLQQMQEDIDKGLREIF